ncbi:MAG: hypothetical protein JWR20_1645, partial [Marmoricola sp.]|nr:hypothetical protein [Marmoricola sp.]
VMWTFLALGSAMLVLGVLLVLLPLRSVARHAARPGADRVS